MVTIQSNKNLHIVTLNDKTLCFSYCILVALIKEGQHYKTKRKYSVTTTRHINQFLQDSRAIELDQAELENLATQ